MRIDGYEDVLNEVYADPPANTPEIVEKILSKYPSEVFNIDDVAYLLLVKINEGFYGLSWLATKKKYQNKGYMSRIMNDVLNRYSGVFIAKTDIAVEFYKKFGFETVKNVNGKSIMILINDIEKIDF